AERGGRIRHGLERHVVLVGVPGREPRRAARARTAHDDRRARPLGRLRERGRVRQLVVRPVEGERLAVRGLPQARDDGELLLQAVEALAERRERYAVGGVLTLEPAAPEAQLNPAAGTSPRSPWSRAGRGWSRRPGRPA